MNVLEVPSRPPVCGGTHFICAGGEVRVETSAIGDLVYADPLAWFVKWIGHAGSIADAILLGTGPRWYHRLVLRTRPAPSRLWLSPDHAVAVAAR